MSRESRQQPKGALLSSSSTRRKFAVLKLGGTSVANADCWQRVARVVRASSEAGEHPIVVCSALSGVTNLLDGWVASVLAGGPGDDLTPLMGLHQRLGEELGFDARAILQGDYDVLAALFERGATDPSPRWQAQVLSMGEQMSCRLATHWLNSAGIAARFVDARDILLAKSDTSEPVLARYLSAECGHRPSPALQSSLGASGAEVTITQGFTATNEDGETVLLGRGGSDTSAAYIAAILEAERLEIWTDVPGLFTSDPRHISEARLVPQLTYDEAAILGSLGAKILHPRCLPPLEAAGIPLHVRWTQRPDTPGTIVSAQRTPTGVRAVTTRKDLCLVVMRQPRRWQPIGFMARVATCFEKHRLSMDLVSSSATEIRATIDLAANPAAADRLGALLASLNEVCEASVRHDVMCVSIVGTTISRALEHVSACLGRFAEPQVHLVTHAADDTHISVIVDEEHGGSLVTEVHDQLFVSDVAGQDGGALSCPTTARWRAYTASRSRQRSLQRLASEAS